jgi:predicted transcriptional regulator of viral defense system
MENPVQSQHEGAKQLFRQRGGLLRTKEALRAGIHPRTLYAMKSAGVVERLSRGLYRLAEMPPLTNPDLVSVAAKVPQGVICLISALAFHELTTQIPHEVYIALGRGAERPRLTYPPLRVFWFSMPSATEGIDVHNIDGVPVRIYSPEKTLADCFKFRKKIGLETAVEALRLYRARGRVKVDDIMRFARICRVEEVIKPYLEAVL